MHHPALFQMCLYFYRKGKNRFLSCKFRKIVRQNLDPSIGFLNPLKNDNSAYRICNHIGKLIGKECTGNEFLKKKL